MPLLIPRNTMPAIKKLRSEREAAGVAESNPYVFIHHVYGWPCVHRCTKRQTWFFLIYPADKLNTQTYIIYMFMCVCVWGGGGGFWGYTVGPL